MNEDLTELQDRQQQFIDERDWEKFHTPKSLAMAISVEASELVEVFQWHDNLPAEEYEQDAEIENAVEEELADIVIYCLSMAAEFDIDLETAVAHKLTENENRFNRETSEAIRRNLQEWNE
ncbi:nucleotide pyrophosphohydrolase [Natrinema salinisoli]|uniref:nucleotide pyrophosphohydrolase n=1 Tax=Natrinema salinisoli TaxID=2878535 RepID=UPI001CEFC369|nr:nucleotide pyrophosphohydrolase [Natrinema salinisoli]